MDERLRIVTTYPALVARHQLCSCSPAAAATPGTSTCSFSNQREYFRRVQLFPPNCDGKPVLGGEQGWILKFKSFDMDSVQFGKAVFVKQS